MNNLDKKYTALLQDILDNGVEKKDRTGTNTLSVFGRQIRHDMSEGFPLLTTKKMHWKSIVTELIWFLKGDTNIKYLVDNDCHIWDGDTYKAFCKNFENIVGDEFKNLGIENSINLDWAKSTTPLSQEEFINKIKTDDEFAKKWGELGPVYGKQWRSWCGIDVNIAKDGTPFGYKPKQIDQIANSINLLKTDPDSRRNRVNAWNVGELDQMVLPPCHTDFQFYTRELSLEERCDIQIKKLDGMYSSEKDIFIKSSIDEVKLITMDRNNIPTRAISLMWNQRSVDTFLGLPFNIASYGLLLEIIAKEVNMVPDELIGNLGDVHLYSNHIEQAKEQIGIELTRIERIGLYNTEFGVPGHKYKEPFDDFIDAKLTTRNIPKRTREPFPLPTLNINTEFWQTESGECGVGPLKTNLQGFEISDFILENYQSHPTIKAPLSN